MLTIHGIFFKLVFRRYEVDAGPALQVVTSFKMSLLAIVSVYGLCVGVSNLHNSESKCKPHLNLGCLSFHLL